MDSPHPFARNLMEALRLDAERLHRLGLFLLGHARVDFHMIGAVAMYEVKIRDAAGRIDEMRAIADEAAEGAFGKHLQAAKERGLLTAEAESIASELNRARNAFVHWTRDRFSLPVYKGQDVTTEEGLRACLDDVLRFTFAVPVWPYWRSDNG